jgi:ATP-citrate lyase alpha-subunit
MTDYKLFDRNTTSLIYGYQRNAIQRMLDFDYVAGREIPSVEAIINPTALKGGLHKAFSGDKEIMIPIYPTISAAVANHPKMATMINFASFRSAYDVTMEALEIEQFKSITVIAEGIPERFAKIIKARAVEIGDKILIGPPRSVESWAAPSKSPTLPAPWATSSSANYTSPARWGSSPSPAASPMRRTRPSP